MLFKEIIAVYPEDLQNPYMQYVGKCGFLMYK
jgi:hypothetical protein